MPTSPVELTNTLIGGCDLTPASRARPVHVVRPREPAGVPGSHVGQADRQRDPPVHRCCTVSRVRRRRARKQRREEPARDYEPVNEVLRVLNFVLTLVPTVPTITYETIPSSAASSAYSIMS